MADELTNCEKLDEERRLYEPKRRAMQPKDISTEEWREYDFGGRVYRIDNPKQLFIGTTTHRIVDTAGMTHCCPAPGFQGCVLRWKANPTVSF